MKLRLNLSFNYVDASHSSTAPLGWTDKRGFSSTTQQLLAEGAAQPDAELVSSGYPSIWCQVYNLMCCTGHPCNLRPCCWHDPVGKKLYKLNMHYLKSFIMHVQDGHSIKTHDNVPKDIRRQLYAEEQLSLQTHQKATRTSIVGHPTTITNVLPSPFYQISNLVSSPSLTLTLDMPSKHTPINRLNIPII